MVVQIPSAFPVTLFRLPSNSGGGEGDGDEGSGSWPYVVPGSRGYAGSLAARDAAIVQAIGALPSPVGTALTRSDLVRLANEEYQEQRSKGKAPTLPRPELPRPES